MLRRRNEGAVSKTAVQVGVILVSVALISVILLNQQRERAARLKLAEERARKEAEENAAKAKAAAPAPSGGNGGAASSATGAKAATIEVKPLGPRDEKAISLQKTSLARPWGRDPFHSVGSVGSTAKAGALTLKGIAYRPSGKSFVMVNEAILREGEEIEGNRVIKIERRQITLSREGRDFILRLEEEQQPAQ